MEVRAAMMWTEKKEGVREKMLRRGGWRCCGGCQAGGAERKIDGWRERRSLVCERKKEDAGGQRVRWRRTCEGRRSSRLSLTTAASAPKQRRGGAKKPQQNDFSRKISLLLLNIHLTFTCFFSSSSFSVQKLRHSPGGNR